MMASRNPFFCEEDDVDDETFLKKSTTSPNNFPEHLSDKEKAYHLKKMQLLEQKRQIEERTVQSSQRSLGLLYESEQIGISTAEELSRQREQLQETEKRLDDINNTLRVSQKHINSVKSIFGAVKNYFNKSNSGSTESPTPKQSVTPSTSFSKNLDQFRTEGASAASKNHPGLRVRGIGSMDDDGKPMPKSQSTDEILDSNLEELSVGLSRLKGLATGLGEEIEGQNTMLDRITDKTEQVDWRVKRQTKEVNKLLKS